MGHDMGGRTERRKSRRRPGFPLSHALLRRIPNCADACPLVLITVGKRTDFPTISPFRFGRWRARSGVAVVVLAPNKLVPSSPRRRPNALLLAPAPAAPRAFATDRRDRQRAGSGSIPFIAAVVAGGVLSFWLAWADRALPVPAAPADRQEAPAATRPRAPNPTPYVPPILIGSTTEIPGASAPFRDSAALRRDGELS